MEAIALIGLGSELIGIAPTVEACAQLLIDYFSDFNGFIKLLNSEAKDRGFPSTQDFLIQYLQEELDGNRHTNPDDDLGVRTWRYIINE